MNEFRWLLRPSAAKLIQETVVSIDGNESVLAISKRLRKSIHPTRAAMVMEQAQLRIRARRKFPLSDEMYFTRRGLEQATSDDLGKYKARWFRNQERVIDVCCGVGGDLIPLSLRSFDQRSTGDERSKQARKISSTVGIDADQVTSLFASRNLEVLHSNAETGNGSKQWVQQLEFEKTNLSEFDAIHCDPDRRAKRKTVRGDLFQPDLNLVYDRTTDRHAVCVKVAPATPLGEYAPQDVNREWIGDRRECKQQLLWSGNWSNDVVEKFGCRTATLVDGEKVHSFSFPESEREGAYCETMKKMTRFLYEPHATVLAAGLASCLANKYGASRATQDIPYLFSNSRIEDGLLNAFEVLDVVSMKKKPVLDAFERHSFGVVECKRRGIDKVTAAKFASLKGPGEKPGVLFLTCAGPKGKRVAIIANRIR